MNKKIVIDSRYYGKSGIGQVNKGILDSIDDYKDFILLGNKDLLNKEYPTAEILDNRTNPFSKKGLLLSKEEKKIINSSKCFFSPAYIIPFGIKTPIYSIIHDCIFFDEKETNNNFIDYLIKKYMYKRAIKKSKTIFTVSNFSKKRIESIFKYNKEIVVLKNGLSKDIINYKNSHRGIVKKENSIIFVGNIKKHKGLDILISAFKIAREKDENLKLYIIGNVDGLRTKFNLSGSLENENIIPMKNISNDDMFSLISKCKYLVLPSRYEGMGLPPLEALYLGTNVILNDIPVFHEFYDNNVNVIFYRQNDYLDLSDKLNSNPTYVNAAMFFDSFSFKLLKEKCLDIINKG